MKIVKKKIISEMNVVPLVDVMLVLLVIFMVTAPMMFNGIELKLPQTKKVHQLNLQEEQVVVSVSRAGEYFLGTDKFLIQELVGEVQSRLNSINQTVFIRADYAINYGKVASLMSYLKSEGISNISLVTEIE